MNLQALPPQNIPSVTRFGLEFPKTSRMPASEQADQELEENGLAGAGIYDNGQRCTY